MQKGDSKDRQTKKPYQSDNIFARLLKGEIPCQKVYEDDFALAFYDIAPKAPIHVLVVPKGFYVDFADFIRHASDLEIAGFFKAAEKTLSILNVEGEGFRLVSNTGVNSGQEVSHFHVHILAGTSLGSLG